VRGPCIIQQVTERRRRSCLDHPVNLVNPLLQYTTGWSCRRTFDNRKLSSKITQLHSTYVSQTFENFSFLPYLPSFPSLLPIPSPFPFLPLFSPPLITTSASVGSLGSQSGRQTTLCILG